MTLKPNGQQLTIREQVIEDAPSGLTFMFEKLPSGLSKLKIYGDLPLGNREIIFDQEGREAGGGTCLTGCRPTWLRGVNEYSHKGAGGRICPMEE